MVVPGIVVAEVSGPLRSILTAERTALNFLCHLSGIATLAKRYVDVVTAANPDTRVLDTRKTTPGLRALEKAAVRAGGALQPPGQPVRRRVAQGQPSGGAVDHRSGGARPDRRTPGGSSKWSATASNRWTRPSRRSAGAVLLDNMSPDEVAQCVALVRQRAVRLRWRPCW